MLDDELARYEKHAEEGMQKMTPRADLYRELSHAREASTDFGSVVLAAIEITKGMFEYGYAIVGLCVRVVRGDFL